MVDVCGRGLLTKELGIYTLYEQIADCTKFAGKLVSSNSNTV